MSSIKNIRFSLPCQEDINQMAAFGQERHCKTCQRTIVDFRNKSQEELDLIKQENATVCGVFSEKQVAKGYEGYRQLVATTVLAVGLSISANAQEENDPFKFPTSASKDTTTLENENILVGVIYDMPEYPGGLNAMKSFLIENIIYPSDSVTGKVWVSFMVDTLGRTQDIKIKKSLSSLADAEVIRVIQLMRFIPAHDNGKPINSRLSLPVSFSLGKEEE